MGYDRPCDSGYLVTPTSDPVRKSGRAFVAHFLPDCQSLPIPAPAAYKAAALAVDPHPIPSPMISDALINDTLVPRSLAPRHGSLSLSHSLSRLAHMFGLG